MARMKGRPSSLGSLMRMRRRAAKVGFKQLYEATGLDPETMRRWEVGDIAEPPLRGALLYARAVGIDLEELAEAAMGEPWIRRAPATELSAGVDQLDQEARELRRRVDALDESALDGDDPPSDEDEPQSDQAG